MFFGSIDDSPHALRSARIMNQKMFSHSGKGLALLFLAILQVMVVDIANLYVIGTDVTFEVFSPRATAYDLRLCHRRCSKITIWSVLSVPLLISIASIFNYAAQ